MASKFAIEEFVEKFEEEPSVDLLSRLKRSELFEVAKRYKISVSTAMKKADLKTVVIEYFIDEGILEEVEEDQSKVESEIAIRQKELDLEIAIQQAKKAEYDLQLAHMVKVPGDQVVQPKFDPTKYIKLVPPFQEKDVEKYFAHFERVADRLAWPDEMRTLLLQSVLVGKAQEAYSALPMDECMDYKLVKTAILKAYQLVPEAYRQKFRERRKQDRETYVEFARDKILKFDSWCRSCKINRDFDKLRQLVLVEEFKASVPYEIKVHLEEQHAVELEKAAVLADDFALTHKNFQKANATNSNKHANFGVFKSDVRLPQAKVEQTKSVLDSTKLVCAYCKKKGHVKSNCWTLQKKNSQSSNSKPVAFTNDLCTRLPVNHLQKGAMSVRKEFLPFVSDGLVSPDGRSDSQAYPVKILRDTASTQSLMLKEFPLGENSSLGTSVRITGIGNESFEVPLHRVYLHSDLFTGLIVVGVTPTLPQGLDGITLLLGNEVAGSKVVAEPCMTNVPCMDNTKLLEEEFPGIFPACVTTRSMSLASKELDEVDLSESFLANVASEASGNDNSAPSVMKETKGVGSNLFDELGIDSDVVLTRDLICKQNEDEELTTLIQKAVTEDEMRNLPVCYFMQSGVLMRKWRPPEVPADNEWKVVSIS